MTQRILNIADVELESWSPGNEPSGAAGERFAMRMGELSFPLGAQKLGYNLTVVPPGKRAFPLHSHRVNEEMFFVIEGSGEIRIGSDTFPIRSGDVIACPPGGPDTAHQIINTGDSELRYLAISTVLWPEIVEYPDSGKFGVRAELARDADGKPQMFRFNGRREDSRDYWEGE